MANPCASQRVEKKIPAIPMGSCEGNWRLEKGPENRTVQMDAQGYNGILNPRDLSVGTSGRTDG